MGRPWTPPWISRDDADGELVVASRRSGISVSVDTDLPLDDTHKWLGTHLRAQLSGMAPEKLASEESFYYVLFRRQRPGRSDEDDASLSLERVESGMGTEPAGPLDGVDVPLGELLTAALSSIS